MNKNIVDTMPVSGQEQSPKKIQHLLVLPSRLDVSTDENKVLRCRMVKMETHNSPLLQTCLLVSDEVVEMVQ